ncbi:MAG TPA: hypothetical protein VND98_06955 [Solirubrobacterales bacterium]|nr:hypothetical protein [Solirubrobacterales bacterium]
MSQQTLDKIIEEVEHREQPLTYEVLAGRGVREADRIVEGFLSVLSRMTREERISASRHGGFNSWERWVWAARYS